MFINHSGFSWLLAPPSWQPCTLVASKLSMMFSFMWTIFWFYSSLTGPFTLSCPSCIKTGARTTMNKGFSVLLFLIDVTKKNKEYWESFFKFLYLHQKREGQKGQSITHISGSSHIDAVVILKFSSQIFKCIKAQILHWPSHCVRWGTSLYWPCYIWVLHLPSLTITSYYKDWNI